MFCIKFWKRNEFSLKQIKCLLPSGIPECEFPASNWKCGRCPEDRLEGELLLGFNPHRGNYVYDLLTKLLFRKCIF